MSDLYEGKQSCWTCRLRKKKCDQSRPLCSACETLSIPCYGYGPKPLWMNDSEKEKSIVNELKHTVRYASRRKGTARNPTGRKAVILAPKPSNASGSTRYANSSPRACRHLIDTPDSSDRGSSIDGGSKSSHSEKDSLSTESDGQSESIFSISAEDSILLMHFLDAIFPLQYPMYSPGILEGGRGWLLALLLRTKPLYYASLALSSYHRWTIIIANEGTLCQLVAVVQKERHLEACLMELQRAMKSVDKFIQHSQSSSGLGTVTSIVQLVFFELFAGEGTVWSMHLCAAINMYDRACKAKLAHLGLSERSRTMLWEDLSLTDDGATVAQEVVSFRFMGGTVIWLDILASITAGTTPRLTSYHLGVIGANSQTKLESIMGCRNWVMIQIGRISALYAYGKRVANLEDSFTFDDFAQNANDISKEVENGVTQEAFQSVSLSEGHLHVHGCQVNKASHENDTPVQVTLITRIFTHMASVYLHLVTDGFSRPEAIDTIVPDVIRLLQLQDLKTLTPSLVCPLFILGCVAKRGDEQQFFRKVFSSSFFLNPLFKYRKKILPIQEKIWCKRETMIAYGWSDVLALTHDLLLL